MSWFKRRSRTLRVFLVRPGEYDMRTKLLTSTGEGQAAQAGRTIKKRLTGTQARVLLPSNGQQGDYLWSPFSTDRPKAYTQTARIIAGELGVEALATALTPPPATWQFPALEELGCPVVMILNGSHLRYELISHGAGDFASDFLGLPLYGSVHELVITYLPQTPWIPCEELSRQFV